jgi:hypothetical protein
VELHLIATFRPLPGTFWSGGFAAQRWGRSAAAMASAQS